MNQTRTVCSIKDTKGVSIDHKSQKILIRERGTFRAETKAGS